MMGQQSWNFEVKRGWVRKVSHSDRPATNLVFIGRTNTAAGGADFSGAGFLFASQIKIAVKVEDETSIVRQDQDVGCNTDTL